MDKMKRTEDKTKDTVDLRKVPRSERPKPSTGQSAESRPLAWGDLSDDERAVIMLLDGTPDNSGLARPRMTRSIEYLADGLEGDGARLRARNALRRPVSCGWVERVQRARYQISELGRSLFIAARS
jgi:hypothetical protein